MEKEKNQLKFKRIDILLVILLVCVILYEVINISFTKDKILSGLIDMAITRFLAGTFFLLIAIKKEYKLITNKKDPFIAFISILPCFLIVFNNLPIISLIKSEAVLNASGLYIFVFILQCLGIGYFEEIAFRGVFFLLFLKNRRNSKKQLFIVIVISSVIFGMYHLFNLFEGANVGGVLMQVGYSALIGAMCTMVFLVTQNIIVPIIIHAGFDFCGTLIPTLGQGSIWNTPTIVITLILSIAVFLYMLFLFSKYDIKKTECFYKDLQ